MLHSEYVRNLNCNYERVLLEGKPEENRYQYCIVGRGGIKRLLPCSLRYINNSAYLYYDISSTQTIAQLFSGKIIPRDWIRNFLWVMKQVRLELERFLLDENNILWYPDQIFQDLDKKDFFFLYIPYYEGETGFQELLDFWVERIDYEDDHLVECVYNFHEQFSAHGETYLRSQIFEDAKRLDLAPDLPKREPREENKIEKLNDISTVLETDGEKTRKGILYFLENRRKKQQEERAAIKQQSKQVTSSFAVAEDTSYAAGQEAETDDYEEEELGRTVYMEEKEEEKRTYRLFTPEGKIVCTLQQPSLVIGKKKEEADCVLADGSVSRLHARITREGENFYIEDMNSTNGTFKNGLRMQPYEKRKLQTEDEIRLGKVVLIFR